MSDLLNLFEGEHPELVMFDLDGTLVDSAVDIAWSIDQMLQSIALEPVGEAQVREWVGNGAVKLIQRTMRYFDIYDEHQVEQALEAFLDIYREHHSDKTQCYPGVLPFLEYLYDADVPLVVVTNKPSEFVGPMLESLELEGYFSMFIGGDSLPMKKPAPEPLIHVLDCFSVAPEQAVMIGDSRNDLLAAKAAETKSIAVSYGYHQNEDLRSYAPDLMVDSLADLI